MVVFHIADCRRILRPRARPMDRWDSIESPAHLVTVPADTTWCLSEAMSGTMPAVAAATNQVAHPSARSVPQCPCSSTGPPENAASGWLAVAARAQQAQRHGIPLSARLATASGGGALVPRRARPSHRPRASRLRQDALRWHRQGQARPGQVGRQGVPGRIAVKHFDFDVCRVDDRSVVCAIELNDASHASGKAQTRDELVAMSAGSSACRRSSFRPGPPVRNKP